MAFLVWEPSSAPVVLQCGRGFFIRRLAAWLSWIVVVVVQWLTLRELDSMGRIL